MGEQIAGTNNPNGLIVQYVHKSAYPDDVKFSPLHQGSMQAACIDLCADVETDKPVSILPGAMLPVPTGLYMAIPQGYEGQVRPRSGLALKSQITIQNTPGTIDSDYRGELKVLLRNEGPSTFEVRRGDRIAQLGIRQVPPVQFVEVEDLDQTQSGAGGLGS